jgi:cellulose synthase/poly-beta-1,6-N-acetylglucosamine synthase-like glycosyltransferase
MTLPHVEPGVRAGVPVTVSVVIPVKDDAAALERCLSALDTQTVAPMEVVVVDNGCTDASPWVARRHGARLVTEPVPGIPAAASKGYDAARGDVIARCDADSLPTSDWVERISRTMDERPGLAALTGNGHFYGMPRGWAALVRPVYLGSYYVLVHAALGHRALWGSNMALRRAVWQEVRDLVHRDDAELHDDMDLAFALGPLREVGYDRRLVVGVSARSVRGRRQLRRRLDRAVRTLRVNWQVQPPWLRWQARLTRGR